MVAERWVPSISEPTGGGPPVTRFSGRMKGPDDDPPGIKAVDRTFAERTSRYIEFNFEDITVIETTAPYPHPIITISIPYAAPDQSRGETAWEALAASLRGFFQDAKGSLENLQGLEQEWAKVPHQVRRPTGENDENGRAIWGPASVPCWEVVGVEGMKSTAPTGNPSAANEATVVGFNSSPVLAQGAATDNVMEHIADLLAGHTVQEFNALLFEDPVAKSHMEVINANLEDKLVPSLILAKLVEKQEDGTYKRVAHDAGS